MDSSSSSRHHKHRDRGAERDSNSHSKKRHHGDDDESKRSHKSSKTHRHSDDRESKHSHRSHSKRSGDEKKGLTVVDDGDDDDMWVEKDITVGGERVSCTHFSCFPYTT